MKLLDLWLYAFIICQGVLLASSTDEGLDAENKDSRTLRRKRQIVCGAVSKSTFKARNILASNVDAILKTKDGMKGPCDKVCAKLCDRKGVAKSSANICECIGSSKCGKGRVHDPKGNCVPIKIRGPGCAATTCPMYSDCIEDGNGVAQCICLKEYSLDKGQCVPIQCKKLNITCSDYEVCGINDEGNAECICAPGSILKNGTCVENPCNLIDCQENSVCIVTKEGEGKCVQDKCMLVRCAQNTECINTENGTICQCLPGYIETPDSIGCISSCATVKCSANSECVVSPKGMASCECLDGYVRDDVGSCIKPNGAGCAATTCLTGTECVEDSNGIAECVPVLPPGCALILCLPNTDCVESTDGTAECVCAKGYETSDNGLCLPVECRKQNITCKDPQLCTILTNGTVGCGCNPGYELTPDGNCTIVDSAACAAVTCSVNTVCVDMGDGSATCECLPGFELTPDGNCTVVDSAGCAAILCPVNSVCDEKGKEAACKCRDGYKFNSSLQCVKK